MFNSWTSDFAWEAQRRKPREKLTLHFLVVIHSGRLLHQTTGEQEAEAMGAHSPTGLLARLLDIEVWAHGLLLALLEMC